MGFGFGFCTPKFYFIHFILFLPSMFFYHPCACIHVCVRVSLFVQYLYVAYCTCIVSYYAYVRADINNRLRSIEYFLVMNVFQNFSFYQHERSTASVLMLILLNFSGLFFSLFPFFLFFFSTFWCFEKRIGSEKSLKMIQKCAK